MCLLAGLPASPGARLEAQGPSLTLLREELESARRLFEALEWESALPVLDAVVPALSALPVGEAGVRELLVAALELRARTRFGLGNREGTRQDLAALLAIAPGHALPANVAAGVAQIFQEVRRATTATLVLVIDPPDATVTVDGVAVDPGGPVAVAAGVRRVGVSRGGYRPVEREVDVPAGTEQTLEVTLERVTARVAVFTSPPGVEVLLDDVARGVTPQGPLPDVYADVATALGVARDEVSAPLYIDDVAPGDHRFLLRKPCHVTVETTRSIPRPTDLRLDVRLEPAVATVRVETGTPGVDVVLNGRVRGKAPLVLTDVCEGPQILELVGPAGRYVRRFEARAGETVVLQGNIAPAVALVSTGGADARHRGEDLRLLVERWFAPAATLTLFAPADEQVGAALRDQRLQPDWLALDVEGRPLGRAADLSGEARREAGTQLARRLGVQGVAGVSLLPGPDPRVVVSLLAAGSGEPDIIEVPLDDDGARTAILAGLDARVPVVQATLDLVAVEVAGVEGVVAAAVTPGGAGAQAGIVAGDAITAVGGTAVRSIADLERALAEAGGAEVVVTLVTPTGGTRSVRTTVVRRPRLVSMDDRMIRFNQLALDLRFRLASVSDPVEESALRLNLAAALLRLGNWAEARRELQRVSLPDGPGVSSGTVQYLLGLTYEAAGQRAEAEQAFRAAAAVPGSLLTETGPLIAELVERRRGRQ